jgi:outer membrane lipoprotein-sorting protein
MNRSRVFLPLALGAVLWLVAPVAPAYAFDAEQLLAELAQNKQSQATFVEMKYLAVLDRPIKSSGTLSFQPPARIEKNTLEPKPELLVLDGDTLTVTRDGRTMTVNLRDREQVLSFVEAIRGVLLGNVQLLEQIYKIQVSGSEANWHMVLTPRDAKLASVIKEIRMGGGEQVRRVEYVEANGDHAVMQIDPVPVREKE